MTTFAKPATSKEECSLSRGTKASLTYGVVYGLSFVAVAHPPRVPSPRRLQPHGSSRQRPLRDRRITCWVRSLPRTRHRTRDGHSCRRVTIRRWAQRRSRRPSSRSNGRGRHRGATRRSRGGAMTMPWWKTSVVYQIYPRSFVDTTGTVSATSRASAAISTTSSGSVSTRSGCRRSTDRRWRDVGYDVSDYCDVDPTFGTLDDFDRAARRRPRAWAPGARRLGAEPYVRPAPVVR